MGPYWTHQWNPISGCSHAGSPGCDNCWARAMHERFRPGESFAPKIHMDRTSQPDHWTKPREVFVCNTGDMFHKNVPDCAIVDVLCAIRRNPRHTFLVLTKRAERMRDLFSRMYVVGDHTVALHSEPMPQHGQSWIQNLWLGVTAENQAMADERIPLLLATPAAHRWVSVEPQLGRVDLHPGEWIPPLGGGPRVNLSRPWETPGPKLDQVIIGAESGPGRRECTLEESAYTAGQCCATGTSLFVKQLHINGKLVTSPAEFPPDLMVRELAWRQGT